MAACQGWESYGPYVGYDTGNMTFHAYNINTGQELWTCHVAEWPWGSNIQSSHVAFAYGNMYFATYDGYCYAVDLVTGKLKWQSDYAGDTSELPYGTWSFYNGPIVADGKLYCSQSEHTPSQPRPRGNQIYCIDAYTGHFLWKVHGSLLPLSLTDGILVCCNEYDGLWYAFGKGQTATTVSASPKVLAKGSSVLIEGTVMDQSTASANTPAIADSDMTVWMDYLHMQNATLLNSPPEVNGVPVTLTATAPDGTSINVGSTTSDGYGKFSYDWTPPGTGIYKIQATFAGSESYWSSTDETSISAKETVSPSASMSASSTSPSIAPPPSTQAAPSMTIYIAIAAAVIAIAAIAAALFLKRRK